MIFEGLTARLAGRPTARLSGLRTLFLYCIYIFFSALFVGSDPDPSLFRCNNETAVSGQSLESCKKITIILQKNPVVACCCWLRWNLMALHMFHLVFPCAFPGFLFSSCGLRPPCPPPLCTPHAHHHHHGCRHTTLLAAHSLSLGATLASG